MSNTEKTRSVDMPTPPKKRRGRPITRFEKKVILPTRCPDHVFTYLKAIQPFLHRSLTAMFEDMLTLFIKERPWERGLHWRKPKSVSIHKNGVDGQTSWRQVNIEVCSELSKQVAHEANVCGQSKASFCYTAIFWWVQHKYPPREVVALKKS
jgi:hypothetical protein